jgi:hypothetical protein
MACHHTKFQMPDSSGSLVIAIKTKPNLDFMHSVLCCFMFYKKLPSQKLHIFFNICYHTSFQDPILSGASVAHTSSTMLVLVLMGNLKFVFGVAFNGVTFVPNFIKIHPAVLLLKRAKRQTHDQPCMHSFCSNHAKNSS